MMKRHVFHLNSCVKTRTGTWALTLQKRVGGEQVHEDYDYNVHKMDKFLSHATVNNKNVLSRLLHMIILYYDCFLSSPEHLKEMDFPSLSEII